MSPWGIFDDPIYRGPDAIESRTFFPDAVLFMAIYFEELELQDYCLGPQSNFPPHLQHWIDEQDSVIQCLLELHEHSMTVLPRIVSLRGVEAQPWKSTVLRDNA